jgi:hypothetical protein
MIEYKCIFFIKRIMKLYGFLALVLVIIGVIGGSFICGIFYERNSQATETVSSVMILDKIENEAIILTKNAYISQESVITVDQGSDWSNFWWGQTITASGVMKVSVGVDFKKIEAADISVDLTNKTIRIALPSAEVLAVSIQGDIEVQNQSGILKLIFDNNTDEDYNKALNQLSVDATAVVVGNAELMAEAKADSIKILQLVLNDTGYTVTFE